MTARGQNFSRHKTRRRGYVLVYRPGHPRAPRRGYVPEHVLVAEVALGKYLLKPAVVHHVNAIRDDNSNHNLVICENQAYHALLHKRMRILAAGGDPDSEKTCQRCKQILPLLSFHNNKSRGDGRDAQCMQCRSATGKESFKRNYKPRKRQQRTVCRFGHPLDEKNTYIASDYRGCRTCHRAYIKKWQAAKKQRLEAEQ